MKMNRKAQIGIGNRELIQTKSDNQRNYQNLQYMRPPWRQAPIADLYPLPVNPRVMMKFSADKK